MLPPIETRKDVELLVRSFYAKATTDELLAPIFEGLDLEAHFPVMFDFWATILLGEGSYRGNAFEKHVKLSLQQIHFTRWMALFEGTVDEHFTGEKAELAKQRANSIGWIFKSKLGLN